MKMYRVKKYRKFPRQSPKDQVIRTVDNLKAAQIISIELNKASNFIAIPYKDIPECCYIAKSEDYE